MCKLWSCQAAIALLACAAVLLGGVEGLCVLKLNISTPQSSWTGGGKMTAPIPGTINSSPVKAAGQVYLGVPTTSCPPTVTADDAVALLQKSSLIVPVGSKSISFVPSDLKGNATDITGAQIKDVAVDFKGMQIALTGNEPLAPGAVQLGTGSAAEAKAAAQEVCSQLVLLDGQLSMMSLLGPRTAAVKNVAMNRTLAAGASIKAGDAKLPVTLYISNASFFLNISKETTPGVEFSRATYMLSGDVVATADLASKASWQQVGDAAADWSAVSRLDAPIVIDPTSTAAPAKGRVIGVNSTLPQQCTPKRSLSADGTVAAAPAAAPAETAGAGGSSKSAAGSSRSSALQVLVAGAAGAVLAALAML